MTNSSKILIVFFTISSVLVIILTSLVGKEDGEYRLIGKNINPKVKSKEDVVVSGDKNSKNIITTDKIISSPSVAVENVGEDIPKIYSYEELDLQQAIDAYEQGDWEFAENQMISSLERNIDSELKHSILLELSAINFYKKNDVDTSIYYIEQAINLDLNDSHTLREYLLLSKKSGNDHSSINFLLNLKDLVPEFNKTLASSSLTELQKRSKTNDYE